MVDTGATLNIVTNDILQNCDKSFDPSKHFMELADGSRQNNIVQKIGDAEVMIQDADGQAMTATLKGALYIPSYPHSIFSVKAATREGAVIILKEGQNEMVKDGRMFKILWRTTDCIISQPDIKQMIDLWGSEYQRFINFLTPF